MFLAISSPVVHECSGQRKDKPKEEKHNIQLCFILHEAPNMSWTLNPCWFHDNCQQRHKQTQTQNQAEGQLIYYNQGTAKR